MVRVKERKETRGCWESQIWRSDGGEEETDSEGQVHEGGAEGGWREKDKEGKRERLREIKRKKEGEEEGREWKMNRKEKS